METRRFGIRQDKLTREIYNSNPISSTRKPEVASTRSGIRSAAPPVDNDKAFMGPILTREEVQGYISNRLEKVK